LAYSQIDKRSTLIKKWFQRATRTDDAFDKFIYSWIALVIAAQRLRTYQGYNKEDDTDRQKILDYFNANTAKILQILEKHQSIMKNLASRKGTNYGNPIVDTGNRELRGKFSDLAAHYLKQKALSDEDLVIAVAELLNKVRNNGSSGKSVGDF